MGKTIKDNKCLEDGVTKIEVEEIEKKIEMFEEKLESSFSEADGGTVTGVKGDKETAYRTGEVNLTPADIGAAASSHSHSYLPLAGGTLSGQLNVVRLIPNGNKVYDLGASGALWRYIYGTRLILPYSNLHEKNTTSVMGVYEQLSVRAVADDNTWRPISAGAFNVQSSRRYKENIVDMTEDEADKLDSIDVVKFDYRVKENGIDVAGVIAEDVYEVLPNVVTLSEIDGKMVPDAVDYSKFVPYLIKRDQLRSKRMAELEERIANLEKKE